MSTKEYDLKKIYSIYVKIVQAHFVYQPSKPKAITAMPFDWIETQNLLEQYLKDNGADFNALCREYISENVKDDKLPSVQQERKGWVHIDDIYRLISGHSNYHGDNILSALTCLAEGKKVSKRIKVLDTERTEELPSVQTCEDAVSRQAVIDVLSIGKEILSRVLDDMDVVGTDREKYSWGLELIESNIKDIEELPSVQPQRKTGKWIVSHVPDSMLWECNQCGFDCGAHSFNFCPNCGAKMEGSK